MIQSGAYRHAGTDLHTLKDSNGYMKVVVDQEFYVDGLQDWRQTLIVFVKKVHLPKRRQPPAVEA